MRRFAFCRMSTTSLSNRVISGPYLGFTKAELLDELDRYKAAAKLAGSRLTGSTVNGQSFTFGPRGDWSLAQWSKQLQAALSLVDPTYRPPSQTIRARME